MLTNPPIPYVLTLKCESASRRFQPGEGILRDCTTSPINRDTALVAVDSLLTIGPL